MPQFVLTVEVALDEVPVEGFPYARRLSAEAGHGVAPVELVGDIDMPVQVVPTLQVANVQGLALTCADADLTLRANGQSDGGLPLQGNWLLLLWDTEIDYVHALNVVLDLPVGQTAQLEGYVIGEPEVPAADPSGYGEGGYGEGGFGS